MSQFNEGRKAFIANEDLIRHTRVKLDAGSGDKVVNADGDEASIGFVEEGVLSGQPVTVRLLNAGGTFKAIGNEAITAGADLFGAADGKVTPTDPGGGTVRFKSLEAGSADNAIIEVLPVTLG